MSVRTPVSIGIVTLGLLAWAGTATAVPTPPDQPECASGTSANPAVSCPDQFAWSVFVRATAPGPYKPAPGAPQQAMFESWATDGDTFPKLPKPATCGTSTDPAHCPVFPTTARATIGPTTPSANPPALGHLSLNRQLAVEEVHQTELVFRNRSAFDYIVSNKLWYNEGLIDAFNKGFVANFPQPAMEVKTNWIRLPPGADPTRWHTTLQGTVTWGLVSMHVLTKDTPTWFWATFEHVDNPGRCDYIGCHDDFGVVPADVAPKPKVLGSAYEPGELTPGALKVLAGALPEFKNYRLKGSQVDYVDPTGAPILVGNSVTENGFVQTSSCMTCHARAVITQTGAPTGNGITFFTSEVVDPLGEAPFGAPNPLWYYNGDPVNRYAVQTDFVWAIPFRAQPIAKDAPAVSGAGAGKAKKK